MASYVLLGCARILPNEKAVRRRTACGVHFREGSDIVVAIGILLLSIVDLRVREEAIINQAAAADGIAGVLAADLGGVAAAVDFHSDPAAVHRDQPLGICGENIRRIRAQKKVTQTDLAARLQVRGVMLNQNGICRIEKGKRVVADYELLIIE